jgi:hypothetical protein
MLFAEIGRYLRLLPSSSAYPYQIGTQHVAGQGAAGLSNPRWQE